MEEQWRIRCGMLDSNSVKATSDKPGDTSKSVILNPNSAVNKAALLQRMQTSTPTRGYVFRPNKHRSS